MPNKPSYEELEEKIQVLEQKVAELKIVEREALVLRTAIDQVPVGIALADENMNLYFCNPEGLGMRGGEKGDLVDINPAIK